MTVTLDVDLHPAKEARVTRIDDIEWLRAVAVLGVVVHHAQDNLFHWHSTQLAGLLRWFDMWSGVDIFFAISGFVIARNLMPRLHASVGRVGRVARPIAAFWVARAFRLLPSAWLWLVLILLAAWQINATGAFGSVHTNFMAALAGIFQVANFRFAESFMRYPYGASFAYWSLSLEEQFYLMLPLLAVLLRKHLSLLLVAIIFVQAVFPRSLLLMSLRTDALAWGVLLALATRLPAFSRLEPRWLNGRRWLQLALSLTIICFIARVSATESLTIGHRVSLIALFSTVLVWLAAYNRDYLSGDSGAIKRLMLWTGHRSYAIYLIHVPAFFLIRELWFLLEGTQATGSTSQTLIFSVAAIVLIAVLAETNFRMVEIPLRRIGKDIARRIDASTGTAPASAPS